MNASKPLVIVTRKLPDTTEVRMMELFDTRLNVTDDPMSRADLIEAVKVADILVPTLADTIDAEILEHAGDQLKLIANFGTGVDHIDVAAARAKNIIVTNTPGVLTEDTADMTMALLLAVPRRMMQGSQRLRRGEWHGWSPTWMLGHRIYGKRLGIVGMGRIGTAVAQRAKAFGLSIHYHNRNRVAEETENALEATYWESLDQMLAHMDIVSINCPSTPATYHLISGRRLALMQPQCYIVNTARGEIIDEDALLTALKNDDLAGAGLDVYEHGATVNQEFIGMDNVVLLPHMGSATFEGRAAMGEKVVINIKTLVDGHKPPDRVIDESMFSG